MLPVAEQGEKHRACCYLGYDTSNFSSVKVLLWGGLRLWLPLKKKKTTKHLSQKTSSSRVTPRRLCLNSREQQAGKGCQEQMSSKVGSIRTPGHCTLYVASALGHTTKTRASVSSPALGAAARKASQGKHKRNHHLPHFPPFQEPVTLQLRDFHSPQGHLGTPA